MYLDHHRKPINKSTATNYECYDFINICQVIDL